jgi:SAM-dependent methyltransferase
VSDSAHQPPRFLTHLFGWYAMTMLAVGARSGLLDALIAAPGTAEDIARRAGVDPRNALEWLRALTVAGHSTFADGRFALSEETAMAFGPGFPVDARAIVDFADRTGDLLPTVAEAIRSGRGVDSQVYQAAYGTAVARVNSPTYAAALVDEWIGGVPGLADRLSAGGMIADLACGNGDAAAIMGRAFPSARVVGYDIDTALFPTSSLPDNVTLRPGDARSSDPGQQFDVVTCLDSFHHFGDPGKVAEQARSLLNPGGVFLVAESGLSGDLAVDTGNPVALIVCAAGLLYCLQENLAAGGPGFSGGDGPDWLIKALQAAGFRDVQTRDSPTGYRIFTATA